MIFDDFRLEGSSLQAPLLLIGNGMSADQNSPTQQGIGEMKE
jgi:hypothetical protein